MMLKHANRISVSKPLASLTLACLLTACSTAQPPAASEPVAGPALWTLSDDDTVIYLFGFAPVLQPGTAWQTDTITAAFNASDIVVLEADSSDPQAQAAVQALIPAIGLNTDGQSLSAALSQVQRDELSPITVELGAPLQALDQLKPWLASIQLGVLGISRGDFDLQNTPAQHFASLARDNGKPIRALEGPTEVMELLAGFPEDEQIASLMHVARTLRDRPGQQAEIADAWLAGDVETIGTLLHGADGAWSSEAVYDAMLVNRNQIWTASINELLAEETGTIFFAVGLGHLAGKDSLITMLRAEGLEPARQ